MGRALKLDIVAPPFAGHLFPLLDLASFLQNQGMSEIRVLCTKDASAAIRHMGLQDVPFLVGREHEVHAIANPGHRVGSNPRHLSEQFRRNLALMGDLGQELRNRWRTNPADLVLADFTVPLAGLTAQSLGIPWWTSCPSPCAIETRSGVPSYLGGWMPRSDFFGRIRDRCGRLLVHGFKRTLGRIFARELRALGIPGVYRPDGFEIVYSPQRILGLGVREFEFERDWPPAFRFVGPLTGGPNFPHVAPNFEPNKRHVLISLGTHLAWAKGATCDFFQKVARELPEFVFHFTHGQPGSTSHGVQENFHQHGYFPYDQYLEKFDVAVTHGGTGIVYSCLRARVPMLVWPQDFDHFDHAARIVHHRLGRRLRPEIRAVVGDLTSLMTDPTYRNRARAFQQTLANYDAKRTIWAEIQRLGAEKGLGETHVR